MSIFLESLKPVLMHPRGQPLTPKAPQIFIQAAQGQLFQTVAHPRYRMSVIFFGQRVLTRCSLTQKSLAIANLLPNRRIWVHPAQGAFHDALALRYTWHSLHTSTTCGCGAKVSIEHTLSCRKGGFPSIRDNKIRDLTANLLFQMCNDISIERAVQRVSGELSLPCRFLQGTGRCTPENCGQQLKYKRTYFDVRIFNPHAASHRQISHYLLLNARIPEEVCLRTASKRS